MNMKKIMKNAEAVSPVIATLMLVLVSVGAAGAFYAWQSGWQSDMTDQVGDAQGYTDADVVIGGSSTVYEFTAVAAPLFEEKYNGKYSIDFQSGGSGAGILAAGEGIVDLGAASKFPGSEDMSNYPDLQVHTVAWDAVVMIIDADHPDATTFTNIDRDLLQAIYYVVGGGDLGTPASWLTTGAVTEITNWQTADANGNNDGIMDWDEIGFTASAPVETYDRSTKSGTEEVFGKQILDCGESEIESVGLTATHSYPGNQGVIDHISNNPNGIAFTSFGMAGATDSVNDLSLEGTPASETTIMDSTYEGGRPINYLSKGAPTGVAKMYLDFCLLTDNNQDISEEAGYISIYA